MKKLVITMKHRTYYALGDSITYGFPYGPNFSWVALVSKRLGLNIANGGINGDTTAGMLRRLSRALADKPDFLILLGGANDAYWGIPAAEATGNVREIIDACLAAGTKVILGMPTPVSEKSVEERLAEYRARYLLLAERYDLPVIPFEKAFLDETGRFREELTTDGCHPNIEGYEAMAEVVEKLLPGIAGTSL